MSRALAFWMVLAVSFPTSAMAQETFDARAEFAMGREAFEQGRFDEALEHFQRCYDMTGEPDLLYNIATVQDRLRQDAEALASFRAYLSARPGAEDREAVEARIRALQTALEREQPALGDPEPELGPDPGGDAMTEPPTAAGSSPVAGITLTVGGGALVVGGAILLGVALADIDAVMSATDWPSVRDAHKRAPALSGVGIAALAVGLAAAGIGLAVWASAGGGEAEVAFGPGTVQLRGRF